MSQPIDCDQMHGNSGPCKTCSLRMGGCPHFRKFNEDKDRVPIECDQIHGKSGPCKTCALQSGGCPHF